MGKRLALTFIVSSSLLASLSQKVPFQLGPQALSLLKAKGETLVKVVNQSIVNNDSVIEKTVIVPQEEKEEKKTLTVLVTGYSSDPLQTDSTPFLTASGTLVREGVAATNFLPLGTKFKIPQLFGDKIFVVEDRMNSRFNDQKIVDIWFQREQEAREFGKRLVTIELL